MLQSNGELKRKWTWAVEWLNDELDRVRGVAMAIILLQKNITAFDI